MHMYEVRQRRFRDLFLIPVIAVLCLLSASLAADTLRKWSLGDHFRLEMMQPDAATVMPGIHGEVRISTEADGGRYIEVRHQFIGSLTNGFSPHDTVVRWEGTILGFPALLLEGGQVSQSEQTLQRGSPLFGMRLVAVLDACQPNGEPVGVVMITPRRQTGEPHADPVLISLLETLTLHAGPEVTACPPEVFERIQRSSNADPRTPPPDGTVGASERPQLESDAPDVANYGLGVRDASAELGAEITNLAASAQLTVRALRGWGLLPDSLSQLALALRQHNIDLLSADKADVEALIMRAPDSPYLLGRIDELRALAALMASFDPTDKPETEVEAHYPQLGGGNTDSAEPANDDIKQARILRAQAANAEMEGDLATAAQLYQASLQYTHDDKIQKKVFDLGKLTRDAVSPNETLVKPQNGFYITDTTGFRLNINWRHRDGHPLNVPLSGFQLITENLKWNGLTFSSTFEKKPSVLQHNSGRFDSEDTLVLTGNLSPDQNRIERLQFTYIREGVINLYYEVEIHTIPFDQDYTEEQQERQQERVYYSGPVGFYYSTEGDVAKMLTHFETLRWSNLAHFEILSTEEVFRSLNRSKDQLGMESGSISAHFYKVRGWNH